MGGSPQEGDSAEKGGTCVGSLCQLLEAGSQEAAASAAPTKSWIPDLDTGSNWSPVKSCSCCRQLCKVTSDCFPFQRQPLWKKLSPLRTQGKWGMGGNQGGLCGWRRPAWGCRAGPLPASRFDLTGFQGRRLDRPTGCTCNGSEPRWC